MSNAYIDSMMVYATIFGYYNTYSPGGGLGLIAHAERYYLDNGTSWESGAGSFYPSLGTFSRVEVSGDTLRYFLAPPTDGFLYRQIDYDSGDHSAQGEIAVEGPLVIVALAGSTDGIMTGYGRITSNVPTWYGEPRFNYYRAPVGSIVPFRLRYRLSGATFTPGLFTTSFSYNATGTVDFVHATRPPLIGLNVTGPARIPDQSSTAFYATAEYQGGVLADVTAQATWTVSPSGAATVTGGLLTVGVVAEPETLTLRASFDEGGVHVEDAAQVVVRHDFYATEPAAWPMYQADSRHTGSLTTTPDVSQFRLLWQRDLGIPLNPVTGGDGRVFCTGVTYFAQNSPLVAIGAGTGATLWSMNFPNVFSVNPPSYAYGNVYIQTGDHETDTWLHAFDAATGERVFKTPHGAQWERYYAPTIQDGRVYVDGGSYGGMYAFDALTGQSLWFHGLQQYDQWTPAISGNYAYAYVGEYQPGLYALNRSDGQQAFMIPDPNFEWNGWSMNLAPVVGTHQDVLAIHDDRLINFDIGSHTIRWQLARAFSGQPTVANDKIYAIDGGALVVMDEVTGATQWSWASPYGALQDAVIVCNGMAFVTSSYSVHCVSLDTHTEIWSYPVSGHLAIANGCLYVASPSGTLSSFLIGTDAPQDPGAATDPVPADLATVMLPLDDLAWGIRPWAVSYQVYFGSDSAAVAAATLGSPLMLGEVAVPNIALGVPLTLGERYFWRVDVVGISSTVTGSIWRFTVAPIVVSPNRVTVKAVRGVHVTPVDLAIDSGGTPQSWTVSHAAPWVTVDHSAGSTPDVLHLTFDTAALALGTARDTLRFVASGVMVTVPVELQLYPLTVSQLVTDFERPYLYALHPGTGQSDDAFLLFVNTATEQIEKAIPIGRNPTDMALNLGEGRLYVTNWGQPVTRVVDLVTQTELAPLALGPDMYKINAGRPGRIYTEGEDQWVYMSTINSTNGVTLALTFMREGDGATDPTGHWYYHCDNNISNAHITRYDISGDNPVPGPTSAEHPYGSRNLVITGDGSKLFWNTYVYNAALTETAHLGSEIYAATLHGDVAFSSGQAINVSHGTVLAALPVTTTVMAVSGDQTKLFSYDPGSHALVVTPMSDIAPVPGPGLNPVPADGATIILPLGQLAWDASPVAQSYRVFFGPDSAAVAAATPGSPLMLGEVVDPGIALGLPLTLGASYFWRVDVVAFSGTTTGAVWRFTVAPLVVSPSRVTVTAAQGAPVTPVQLALSSGGTPRSWSVTHAAPWMTVDHAAGSTPDVLRLTFDTHALALGTVRDTLRFTVGSIAFVVPVELRLIQLTLSQMVADYDRPYVYALHPGSGQFDDAFLVFINTNVSRIDKIIPIGKNPTDMAVHRGEGRLYVTNWGQPLTRVVDLKTQTELPPLALGTDVYKVNAGRPGRIYTEGEDQWIYLRGYNSADGALTTTGFVREGDGATDRKGRWYYHCDNNISNAHITRYDITTDDMVEGPHSPEHPYGSRNLVMSGDDNRLFWRGYVYDAALTELRNLGEEIYATTRNGDIAFSMNHAIDAVRGMVLKTLPLTTTVMAVSGDDAKLFYFDLNKHSVEDTVLEQPTPAAIALVATDVGPDRVRITWHVAEPGGELNVERSVGGEWSVVGTVTPDAEGTIVFEDDTVAPGTTFRYRLAAAAGGTFGEVLLRTPDAVFALHGMSPNPSTRVDRLAIRFSLPKQGTARLSVIDVQGRVVWDRTASLSAGEHTVPIDAGRVPRSGVYFARLESAGRSATQRFVVLQ